MPGIQDVGSTGAGPWARMLLYAHPGHHKTSLIGDGTAGRVLIIRSPLDNIPARIRRNKNVKEMVVSTWEQMSGDSDSVLQYLRHEGHTWDWVWLDCLSIMQSVLLNDVWEAVIAEKPHRASLTPSGGMDRGEYWRNAERLDQFIRHACVAEGYNFGITCHVDVGEHPDDPDVTISRPAIHVKGMVSKITGYMNLVGYMKLEEDNGKPFNSVHFRESPYFYAKDLYDAFPDPLRDPSMGGITEAIQSAYAAQKPQQRGRRSATPTPPRRGGRKAVAAGRGGREQ